MDDDLISATIDIMMCKELFIGPRLRSMGPNVSNSRTELVET